MEYLGEISNKFNDYVSYIKEHRNNVSKAWKGMQKKCKHEQIVYDDWIWNHIDECIKRHDLSKFDKEEFTQYRLNFYPCQDEQQNKEEFEIAWKHHYETNDHHWQHWVNKDGSIKKGYSYWHRPCAYVEMICDWQAMGYKFGSNALCYYDKIKADIVLIDEDREFIERILKTLCE